LKRCLYLEGVIRSDIAGNDGAPGDFTYGYSESIEARKTGRDIGVLQDYKILRGKVGDPFDRYCRA
jgi:hypothetical protein